MSSIFSKITKFIGRYGDEIHTVASSLSLLTRLLPIDKGDRDKIEAATTSLFEASTSIAESISEVEKAAKAVENAKNIKVSKADIKNAVAELAPDLLAGMIETAVRKALADQSGEKASK